MEKYISGGGGYGWGKKGKNIIRNGQCEGILEGDGAVLYLIVMVVMQIYTHIKIHRLYTQKSILLYNHFLKYS